jgi:tetratricopeptide (TPR) repeat protein
MNPAKRLVQFVFVVVIAASVVSGQLCEAKPADAPNRDANFYIKRGIKRSMQGDNRGAEAEYRIALNLEPKNQTAIFNHANALCRLGEYRRGINEYTRAIKIDERNSLAFVGRGCAKAKLGDTYSAIEDFDQAIRLDQHNWIAYLDRSVAKSKLPENRDYFQDYEKALELDSNVARNFFNLPESSAMKKNPPIYNTTNSRPLSFDPSTLTPSKFERVRQIADDPKLFSTKYDAFRRFPELFVFDVNPENPNSLEKECIPKELQILANSNLFADGVSGLMLPIGAKHELYVAFQCAMTAGASIPTAVLKEYFENATPSGKLYLAILLRKFDPKVGNDVLKSLADDPTKVGYRNGCMILEFTVGQVARLLAVDKSFQRFMTSNMILTIDEYVAYMRGMRDIEMVEELSSSKVFEALPPSFRSSTRFNRPKIGPVSFDTLKKLYAAATPAGKLYVAAIMQQMDPKAGASALSDLFADSTVVTYIGGEVSKDYSVSEIARELLRSGSFQDFSIKNIVSN